MHANSRRTLYSIFPGSGAVSNPGTEATAYIVPGYGHTGHRWPCPAPLSSMGEGPRRVSIRRLPLDGIGFARRHSARIAATTRRISMQAISRIAAALLAAVIAHGARGGRPGLPGAAGQDHGRRERRRRHRHHRADARGEIPGGAEAAVRRREQARRVEHDRGGPDREGRRPTATRCSSPPTPARRSRRTSSSSASIR